MRIPIRSQFICIVCGKKFWSAAPWAAYCSDYCDGKAQADEDKFKDLEWEI